MSQVLISLKLELSWLDDDYGGDDDDNGGDDNDDSLYKTLQSSFSIYNPSKQIYVFQHIDYFKCWSFVLAII